MVPFFENLIKRQIIAMPFPVMHILGVNGSLKSETSTVNKTWMMGLTKKLGFIPIALKLIKPIAILNLKRNQKMMLTTNPSKMLPTILKIKLATKPATMKRKLAT